MKERTNHNPFTGCQPGAREPHNCVGSLVDHGKHELVTCPCPCHAPPEPVHEHSREESGRVVRVACTCGWRGRWRSRSAYLLEKQLHSDDGEHLYAVRRGEA